LGNINTICVDKAGKYWLGTNDAGIICFDPQTEEKVIYDKASHGIGSNTMVGSLAASDGSVWFGTYEGGLIHIKDGHVTNYREQVK
jgi:ligand-binding sensor domain-containing protein